MGGEVTERAERLRRVRLTPEEARAASEALRRGASSTVQVSTAVCTDVYLDRPGGTLARRAASVPEGALRVVLREWPGQDALSMAVEVEQGGWQTTRSASVHPGLRHLALDAGTARALFPFLPEGVSPALVVRCRRTVLRHADGWWARVDESPRLWAVEGAARSTLADTLPALPLGLLVLHDTGPSVPPWLSQLAYAGPRCPDLFGWEALLRKVPTALRPRRAPGAGTGPAAGVPLQDAADGDGAAAVH